MSWETLQALNFSAQALVCVRSSDPHTTPS
jgi:hypothetical protein